jgi:hypothetical protein
MRTNKKEKVIPCIISLILVFNLLISCTSITEKNVEFTYFEEALKKSNSLSNDSIIYVFWSTHSCGGCRDKTQVLVSNYLGKNIIKIIVPAMHADELTISNKSKLILDEHNFFSKKHFGVDNIGIIKTVKNEVYFIKNYNPNEMIDLEKELLFSQ